MWGEREMRGKRRILCLAALLSILLAVPVALGLGIVDIPGLPFASSSSTPQPLSTTWVLSDPDTIIKDYELDPGYTIGDKFTVHVNVSGVSDLFVWQVKIVWTTGVLNVSRIIPGTFLAGSPEQTSTEALGWVMNRTENDMGSSVFAESILGNVTGVSGSGRLVSIEFLILDYNCTDITLSLYGSLNTELLDSLGSSIAFDTVGGYFKNKIAGDANGDGIVTGADAGTLSDHWTGPPAGLYPYNRDVDQIDDGQITGADAGIVSDNWLRSVVLP